MMKMKLVCSGKMDSLDDMKKYMGTVHLHHFDSGCRKCRNASFKGKHSNLIINIKS